MEGKIVGHHFGPYLTLVGQEIIPLHFPKTNKNAIKPAVGDQVEWDEKTFTITRILPRKNYLIRPNISNLDALFIVSSIIEPSYSLYLNLKFLTFALFHALKPTLILTKLDLQQVSQTIQVHFEYLKSQGIETLSFDVVTLQGIQEMKALMKNKTVAFAGQTGVGKSTIINAISPDFKRTIGSYSKALGRGRHQTKEVILVPFQGGYIADTPGFSSLELGMDKTDLSIYFPGFKKYLGQCKFANCLHHVESGCRVKNDLNNGKIPLDIYQVYVDLLNQTHERKIK